MTMLKFLPGLIVALVLSLPQGGSAADLCARPGTADAEPAMVADSCDADRWRMAEGGKNCTESCMSQCRSAARSCSGANCNAQFQICARRCVVSCGAR
jgi:hypothetical protein